MSDIEMRTLRAEARRAALAAAVRLVDTAVRFAAVRMRRAVIARRDARLLSSMPDSLLKDIGLGRSEIESAVRLGRAPGRAAEARLPIRQPVDHHSSSIQGDPGTIAPVRFRSTR